MALVLGLSFLLGQLKHPALLLDSTNHGMIHTNADMDIYIIRTFTAATIVFFLHLP